MRQAGRFSRLRLWHLALAISLSLVFLSTSTATAAVVIESPNHEFSGTGTFELPFHGSWFEGPDRVKCTSAEIKGKVPTSASNTAQLEKWALKNCTARDYYKSYASATVEILSKPKIEALNLGQINFGQFTVKASFQYQGKTCSLEYTLYELTSSFAARYENYSTENRVVAEPGPSLVGKNLTYNYPCPNQEVGWANFSFTFQDPQFEIKEVTLPPPPPGQAPTVGLHPRPALSATKTNVRLFGSITPNERSTNYHFEYGPTKEYGTKLPEKTISSGLSTNHQVDELIEGLQPGAVYHYRLVATNSEGTSSTEDRTFTTPVWETIPSPNQAGAGESQLEAVECALLSTSMCMAVGKSTVGESESVLAEQWNGTNWALSSPVVPTGATDSHFEAVTCPSTASCRAAGSYTTASGTKSLIEAWDGSSWSVQESANVAGASSTILTGISCPSGTNGCGAVGYAITGGVRTLMAQRWNGTEWSMDTVAPPPGSSASEFRSVECRGTNFCMAVGVYTVTIEGQKYDHPLSALWNGSTWSLKTVPEPGGYRWDSLADVSCTGSPVICTAVGDSFYPGEEMLAVRWNGSAWVSQPKEAYLGGFTGVSCSTTDSSSCVSVGSAVTLFLEGEVGTADLRTTAARWDGTSWVGESTTGIFGAGSVLRDVSCRGSTCIAVGFGGNILSGEVNTFVESTALTEAFGFADPLPAFVIKPASSSTPTSATLRDLITPNGLSTTYQFEYGTTTEYGSKAPASPKSIGSGTSPVEVSEKIEGLAPETTYHFRLVATNAEGTIKGPDQTFTTPSWEILSTPNPSGASDSRLYDVSCEPSTNVCTSVGKSTISGADIPVAQRWNGTSWSEQTAAKKSGSAHNRLFSVDCPSETRCLAVGNYQNSEGSPTLMAEIWNENKWSVQTTPVPSEATSSELGAIGCNNTAECKAVGSAVVKGVKTAIAEKWVSPSWSSQTVPIPEGATSSQLDGVDCLWSNWCVAVGRYTTSGGSIKSLAMFWNGTSWSLQTLTDPEKATQSTLLDVSCTPSPNIRCTAVGGWRNSAGEQFTLAYRYNGSTWTLQSTPNPSGSAESVLQDVSCATETSCTAAGSWIESGGGSTQTLAEKWNGTSWSIQGTSNPSGSAFSTLFGVSCRSTTCMGVGWSANGSGVETTLGEFSELSAQPPTITTKSAFSSAPTKATLKDAVNPNGSETTYQFEYGTTSEYGSKAPASPKSIGAGGSAVEVSEGITGLTAETTYHFRVVATNAKGTVKGPDQTFTTPSWAILSTPNPSGASDTDLYDVSCEPSTSVCTSVGKSTASGVDSPLAQRWNGTSWSEQTAAKKSGSTHNRLLGVDCPSETRCLAVGNYQNSEGGPATLGELWNESKWSVQATPVPSEATSSELVAVGCSWTSECGAVGSAVIKGVKTAIAERWVSPTWSLQTVPIPEGATSSQLDGIDCLWSTWCVAVGRYTTSGGSIKSLPMFWNGTEWKIQTLTEPEKATQSTLLDISCTPSPNRCTAVGGWKNSKNEQFTLAYRFNGTSTWTLQSTPNPSGGTDSVLQEVSCVTETSCTAVGSSVPSATNQTLAEKWNGTSWSIQGTPNPSGAAFSALFGVSCRSTTCMGVGWSTDASGVETTLGEIRE